MKRLFLLLAVASVACAQQEQQELDAYRRVLMDFGGLIQYGSDDAELSLHHDPDRVVFLGDEITEKWPGFLTGKHYVNRGITRQTTAQMLLRFRQDVIDLQPKVVVIEAGTNDLASVLGPSSEGTMADNFMSMVELAKAHAIRVVLASVTPTQRSPAGKIISLNNWLKNYAAQSGSVYVDYYSALVNKNLTIDGFIPTAAGYRLMEPLVQQAIESIQQERPKRLASGANHILVPVQHISLR
jgi:lysophospholipase L1-like esterase